MIRSVLSMFIIMGIGADVLSVSVNPSEIALGDDSTGVVTAILSPVGKVPDGAKVQFSIDLGSIVQYS